MNPNGDIAVIGLAVMGQNLILNMNDKGFTVVVYNRTVSKVDELLAGAARGREKIIGAYSINEMVSLLKRPRKIMLMVKAGSAVDDFIELLLPHMEKGDLIIDGGNSNFTDTIRRTAYLEDKGILFLGVGISGGEEGARHGPSIMPGGNPEAWPLIKDIFQSICAKAKDGQPCCDWVGPDGAGHFVKMVHNGIEYGDMQIIAEAYHILRDLLQMPSREIHEIFSAWNSGPLNSYLIEITSDIFARYDEQGAPLVEKILDAAGQKGTGQWTVMHALELGVPVTLIAEAVFSRSISAMKEVRILASTLLKGPSAKYTGDKKQFVNDLEKALYASKIVSYAQGFMLMRAAAERYHWSLNFGSIAQLWRAGCIIRSGFLGNVKDAFQNNPALTNLLLDPYFTDALETAQKAWRSVIARAIEAGIPIPALSSALSFYDGYRCAKLPANLLQAQRDYFGVHTYERIDKPRGKFFHTDWK